MKLTDKITITNEDNMELMSRYPDKYFDLAIVDPPYGIETKGNAQDRFNMGKDLSLINDAKPTKEYSKSTANNATPTAIRTSKLC